MPVPGVPGSGDTVSIMNGGTATISSGANVELAFVQNNSSVLSVVGGGSLAISQLLHVDWDASFEQSGGQVSATNENVGNYGTGTFRQTGGTNTTHAFQIGFYSGSNGTYELSGNGQFSAHAGHVGRDGTGTFRQTGGTNTIQDWLAIGFETGSNGTYELSGNGELSTFQSQVGRRGTGTFTQTGGSHSVQSFVFVGGDGGGDGTYNLSNGTLTASIVSVGDGDHASGIFIQSGGDVTINDLLVGRHLGGEGVYELHGGTINVGGWITIGQEGKGSFIMDGGTINATDDGGLIVFGGTGSLTGPGTFNIEVVYLSEEIYGTNGDDSVDIIFERYCLFKGGTYEVKKIYPYEFGGCTEKILLPSSVFDVSFDGNFSVGFTIVIPYDPAELAALNADEMSLRAVRKDAYGYELLEDVQIDTTEKVVYSQAGNFGKFALFAEGTGSEAAKLAKSVIGGPYLGDGHTWGGKGANCSLPGWPWVSPEELHTSGYCYYDAQIRACNTNKEAGVDCSGLVMWAYNKETPSTGYFDPVNPISHKNENASRQYHNNSSPIAPSELMPGDLLFFDSGDPGIDHVEMYVGAFFYEGGSAPAGLYNIVSAAGSAVGIIPRCLSERTQPQTGFVGFRRVTTPPIAGGTVFAQCPVDLILTDPDGFTITKDIWEIPGVLYYNVFDIDKDGDFDDMVTIVERKIGDYLISVVPEPDASPTDTYTLGVNFDGQTLILAENVSIDDIPDEPYIFRSTEIIPIIPERIDFDPDTLNLKSQGKLITCYIELPEGYDVDDIDVGSILLGYLLEIQHSDVQDDVLMVKFDRQDVIAYIELVLEIELPADVTLTVTGELTDGTPFEGIDTIRVIDKGKGKNKESKGMDKKSKGMNKKPKGKKKK